MMNGPRRRIGLAGLTLGIALAGFFDGILFHQILQWHHLLSGLDGVAWRSLRAQVMADGLFHALMYAVALFGLGLLWRARRASRLGRGSPEQGGGAVDGAAEDTRFVGGFVTGFGLFHVIDVVLLHWVLGLHHVRMDAEEPLYWDAAVFLFGAAVTLVGLRIWRRGRAEAAGGSSGSSGSPGSSGGTGPSGAVAALAMLVVTAGAYALRPNPDGLVTAVFAADAGPARALTAAAHVHARIVWLDPSGTVAVYALPERGGSSWGLYRAGAVYVSGTAAPEGCFGWVAPTARSRGTV